jgi:hypothetical protein
VLGQTWISFPDVVDGQAGFGDNCEIGLPIAAQRLDYGVQSPRLSVEATERVSTMSDPRGLIS